MTLLCPVCGAALIPEKTAARCEKGHAFDRARSGYLNLLLDSASHGHGDDKAMLSARRFFLSGGWYMPLMEKIAEKAVRHLPEGGAWVDAGCGEGSYTEAVLTAAENAGKKGSAFAFDISKEAARLTAGRLRERGCVFVASCYRIPLSSGEADLVLSLFSPFARAEYARVLRPGGILLRAVPDRDHLMELKEALYDAPRPNIDAPEEADPFFDPLEEIPVRTNLSLPGKALRALFEMTPYARKTSSADREKLAGLTGLSVTASFRIVLSAKKAC